MSCHAAPNASRLRTSWRPTSRRASLGAAPLELVDRDGVREFEHLDLLELRRRAELRCHHVQRAVDERDDLGVALPDAGRLDDDQVEARGLQHGDRRGEVLGQPPTRAASGHRPEEDVARRGLLAAEAVTGFIRIRSPSNAPPTPPVAGVDGEHGDAQLVLLVAPEPPQQLVGQRRLARAARPRDAQHRDLLPRREVDLRQAAALGECQYAGDGGGIAGAEPVEGLRRDGEVDVALLDHQVDHPGQPEPLAVVGRR